MNTRSNIHSSLFRKECPHCDPVVTHPFHLHEKIQKIFAPLNWLDRACAWLAPPVYHRLTRFVTSDLVNVLIKTKVLCEVDPTNTYTKLPRRLQKLVAVARKRSLPLNGVTTVFGTKTALLTLPTTAKRLILKDLLPNDLYDSTTPNIDDKKVFSDFLTAHNFPRAKNICTRHRAHAHTFYATVQTPLVVKPRFSSLSKHITTLIDDPAALQKAITVAKKISNDIIIEKYIPGTVHRVTVVDGAVRACCVRTQPRIIGDGIQTIEELIKNRNQKRKSYDQAPTPLSKRTMDTIAEQGFRLSHVPATGQTVYLHTKVTRAAGADFVDVTSSIHPDNIALFEQVTNTTALPIVGLDVIMSDISLSYKTQPCAIIEANANPNIEIHSTHNTNDKAEMVAHSIVDILKRHI